MGWCVQINGKAYQGQMIQRMPMKCIYCEENETKGVLLCYGCQVDLFPLVSAWAYCGVCGNDLSANTAICPHCAQTANFPTPVTAPSNSQEVLVSPPASPQMVSSAQKKSLDSSSAPPPKKTPVSPEELRRARRFQWIIKSSFAIFWLTLLLLVLLWARDYVNQPIEPFVR